MKVIGIDYGTKRIGVAVSDDEGAIAFPRVVLPHRDAVAEIVRIAEEEGAEKIVVGESLNAAGEDNELMVEITPFARRLEDMAGIPVYLEPEQFTSMHAAQAGNPTSHRGALSRTREKRSTDRGVDAAAAALILQRYLDRARFSTKN